MKTLAEAEIGVAAGRLFGVPFESADLSAIVDALRRGAEGDGSGGAVLATPKLDPETHRAVQLCRFRQQAARAATQTAHYGALFAHLAIDPTRLTWEQIGAFPLTPKEALRDRPYDFVCRDAAPVFRATTTGTTGRPTSVCFSARELLMAIASCAISNLTVHDITPEDIYLISAISRPAPGNITGMGCVAMIGAMSLQLGVVDPEETLGVLAEEHRIPGKAPKVTQMLVYPSYLGELVETGLRLGFRPSDFGLRHLDVSGEIVTDGLRRRSRELFGDVDWFEGYGMTETWGMGGERCSAGHHHFGHAGLVEWIEPDSGRPAGPGEVARIVATPLPPHRETTLLLRYDTQDMVRMLEGPPDCPAAGYPAASGLLGKRKLSVRLDDGWVFPRDVLEALESLDVVPLPARCGYWREGTGVVVEVVTRRRGGSVRAAVGEALEARGVPLRRLVLRGDRMELRRPYPLRGDLREGVFAHTGRVAGDGDVDVAPSARIRPEGSFVA